MMEFTTETRKKLSRWLIGTVSACILIFLGVQNIGIVANAVGWVIDLFMPLVIGGAIALILNVPMVFSSRSCDPGQKRRGQSNSADPQPI